MANPFNQIIKESILTVFIKLSIVRLTQIGFITINAIRFKNEKDLKDFNKLKIF